MVNLVKSYLFWIVLFSGIFSLQRLLGVLLTYLNEPLHNIGNILFVYSYYLLVPATLLLLFLIMKRVPFSIILLPLLFVLHVSLVFVPFHNSFLDLFADNFVIMAINLCLVIYSVVLILRLREAKNLKNI